MDLFNRSWVSSMRLHLTLNPNLADAYPADFVSALSKKKTFLLTSLIFRSGFGVRAG